jgi:predicted RNase H-like HicB family nuclease
MTMASYLAIVERGKEGFGVFFPDLPGCTSAGDTVQDAARNAVEALEGHILTMAEHGDNIPAPSDVESIGRDPDVDEVARLLVQVELPGRA